MVNSEGSEARICNDAPNGSRGLRAQEIRKLPFNLISGSMTGKESIAVGTGSKRHRRLWPRSGPPGNSLGCNLRNREPTLKA